MQCIKDNLERLRQQISESAKSCGRKPEEITLIAVSKTHPVDYIVEAFQAGQCVFGENKMQELSSKMEEINLNIEWHMIGTIQTNKIKYIATGVHWIHSVDKAKYFKEINKRVAQANRSIKTLIQVNISNEPQKGGIKPEELPELLDYAQENATHFTVNGLMGIASFEDNMDLIRSQFALLRKLRDTYADSFKSDKIDLKELSMGMSHDMKAAIEEGATMVRVGSAIFGNRDYS